ncbi:MAG: hypothetical protein HC927_02490 [Deltaproteobacteria bacterium]|nr:hypothetical protein [Deltaproteobacteria bacterium]
MRIDRARKQTVKALGQLAGALGHASHVEDATRCAHAEVDRLTRGPKWAEAVAIARSQNLDIHEHFSEDKGSPDTLYSGWVE